MKIKETISCDVLVVGAGSAGLAAAVAASRLGAHVVLVEKNGYAGGKATAAYVNTLCGLYYRSDDKKSRYVTEGFMMEFAERLKHASQTNPISNALGLHFLPYNPFQFKLLCDDYLKREKIDFFFHTIISGIKIENNKCTAAELISYDREITISFKSIVDTTGEATLSQLAQLPFIETETYQASAQVFSMEGVKAISESNLSMILMKEIQKAIVETKLPATYSSCSVVPGSFMGSRAYFKIGIPIEIKNEVNKVSSIEVLARKMVVDLIDYLNKTSEAFKNAYLSDIAPEVGIRTGRRHIGKYMLTKEDVLMARKTENTVAKGTWPIEYWEIGKRVRMEYFDLEDYYSIPDTCLVSSKLENLFFAGKNSSATEEAIASARVIGTCLQTGYAAGEMAVKYFEI